MNLYKYIEQNIKIEDISELNGDKYEMAIVRMVLKRLSNFFYRDYTFFLNKENLIDRKTIYNKKVDLKNVQDFSVVCKTYCEIIQELIGEQYGIVSKLISPFEDEFRHIDLLITTKSGNTYIVDPLSDLVEMQVGLKTNNFASKEYYNKNYLNKLDGVSFFTGKELEEIDDKINYKISDMYLDDFLEKLKTYFDNIEKNKNENESKSILENEDMMTEYKLKFICEHLNYRQNINGLVDLIMYLNIIIKKIFSEKLQEKIRIYSFFVDEEDLQDKSLKEILDNKGNRRRGVIIEFKNKIYVFSLNSNYLEYNDKQWKDIIKENKIFVRPKYFVKLIGYLKENGVDRNIVHNNEFLRLFNKFEEYMINKGATLEDIKNENVVIKNGNILTKFYGNRILYKIEGENLVVEDFGRNIKYTIVYEDEGRKITHRMESILKHTDSKESINDERG